MAFLPHWPKILGKRPDDFGTERILRLLENLGNPQQKLPPVVHVAGTNGKGSTIAFMRSILQKAGYKVHVYTSPHLLNFNERIVLAGNYIQDDHLTRVMETCRLAAEGLEISFFEGTTAGAFLAFSEVKADILLLETGMGGRLDATNVVDHPLLTAITPISLDHTEYLGDHIAKIAYEKAGIIKKGTKCIVGQQFDDALTMLQHKADEVGTELFAFGYDFGVEKDGEQLIYRSDDLTLTIPNPSLLGDHQYINASTAIAAVTHLPGFTISEEHIATGITSAKWAGRMQKLTHGDLFKHLPEGWEIWLDGAHNTAGAHIVRCQAERWKDKPLYLVCGFTKGRKPAQILEILKDHADHLCGVLVETEPCALEAHAIAEAANSLGIPAKAADSIPEALAHFTSLSKEPARVLFCGSLYLTSDALKWNGNRSV